MILLFFRRKLEYLAWLRQGCRPNIRCFVLAAPTSLEDSCKCVSLTYFVAKLKVITDAARGTYIYHYPLNI
jgi:hypothetical protein